MNTWLLLLLLTLTTYRATRFVVEDDFPPMLWIRDRLAGGWRPVTQKELTDNPSMVGRHRRMVDDVPHVFIHRAKWVPEWLASLLSCPWCASGWLSAGIVASADAWVSVPLPVAFWGAVWGAGAILAAQSWA